MLFTPERNEHDMAKANTVKPISVNIKNIGGIETAEAKLSPGVTVLAGRNATNRTSFLQGLMAAMGSAADEVTLKSDADEGQVTVQLGGTAYTRTIKRSGDTIITNGEPYSDDAELLDLYAFLLRENPVRQTVEREGDLHEILMRPIDTDKIEAELHRLRQRKEDITAELEQLEQYKQQLPQLEKTRTKREAELEDLQAKESELQKEKEALETQLSDAVSGEKPERVQELEEELTDQRAEQNKIKSKLNQQRDLREAAKEDLAAVDKPATDREELQAEQRRLRTERDRLTEQIETLRAQQEEITTGMNAAQTLQESTASIDQVVDKLEVDVTLPDGPLTDNKSPESDAEALTNSLMQDEKTQCLACGSQVSPDAVSAVIEQYREINTAFRKQIQQVESQQEEVRSQLDTVKAQLNQWEQAEDRLAEAETQKQQAEAQIKNYEQQLETATEAVEKLETELKQARAEATTDPDQSLQTELDAVEDELIDTEVDIRQTESELKDIESQIEELETELEAEPSLRTRRDDTVDRIETLQSRVENTERELVDEFNQTIETVLELLDYNNIERIWIERKRKNVRTGRQTQEQTVFELNIVREGADGVYTDDLRHLSESERSVTGLVVALTGYIVHDVAEICPLMLLDSIEMIDSERIADLIEYFAEETEYLIAALLPEDSAEVVDSLPKSTLIEISSQVE